MARPKDKDLQKRADKIVKDRTETYRWWEQDDGKKLIMLEQAFKIDATDEEACTYADITPDQLYYYQREINQTFQVEKALWKKSPTLKARRELVSGLKDNPELSLKYLERKVKDEFSPRTNIVSDSNIAVTIKVANELKEAVNEALKQRLRSKPRDTK